MSFSAFSLSMLCVVMSGASLNIKVSGAISRVAIRAFPFPGSVSSLQGKFGFKEEVAGLELRREEAPVLWGERERSEDMFSICVRKSIFGFWFWDNAMCCGAASEYQSDDLSSELFMSEFS